MSTKDLFRNLLTGAGFYRRNALYFLILILLIIGAYYAWHLNRSVGAVAEFPETSDRDYVSSLNLDITVTREAKVYVNNKKDKNALRFYDNHDEVKIIVFNVPEYSIGNFEANIHLPAPSHGQVRPIIYAVHGVGNYSSKMLNEQTINYQASDISPQAVLTIVAELPKGMVQPNLNQKIAFAIQQFPVKGWIYVAIILPLMTIIFMTFMVLKRRSDQLFLVKHFLNHPPSADPPAIVGVLLDGTVGAREIAATLVDLAHRGHLIIVNKGNLGFTFGKRRGSDFNTASGLSEFEKILLSKIFLETNIKSSLEDVEMRIGRHIFSRKIAQFYLDVYNIATRNGYFVKNPAKVHLAYKYVGVVLFFLSFLGFVFGAITGADPKFGLLFWVGGMLAAYAIIKFAPLMPARSKKGQAEMRQWLSFERFMITPQVARSGEIFQDKFQEYLPYAIVMGVEVEWAKRFGRAPFTKPEWYESLEQAVTLDSFMGEFMPFIGYVCKNLARSHEPTVE